MKKMIALLTAIMLLLSACSGATVDSAGKELGDTVANITDADNKYVQMVKGGYRTDNPNLTYEDAFSSFFATPRWKYFESEDGQNVVEFTGDCTYQDVPVKARIQFVVDEESGTFEAVYLAFNEVPQDTLILSALISKAFEEAAMETGETGGSRSTDTAGQVFICGIPVQNVMEMSENELIESFGKPDMYTEGYSLEYGVETPEWLEIYIGDDGKTDSISANAEKYTYDGQSLMQNEDSLVALLGSTYQNLGGIGESFQYQWTFGSYSYVVTFPLFADDSGYFMPYSIYVYKADIDDNATEDDYSWVEGDIESETLDPMLAGRWRSNDGGTLELSDNGTILNSDFKCWSVSDATPDQIYWSADNGRVTCSAYFNFTDSYYISDPSSWDGTERLRLTSRTDNEYKRTDGVTGSGLVGTWDSIYGWGWGFQFNEDGTGVCNNKYPITWNAYTADDGKNVLDFTILDTTYFDYKITGSTLTVFLSDGSRIYTKVGN